MLELNGKDFGIMGNPLRLHAGAPRRTPGRQRFARLLAGVLGLAGTLLPAVAGAGDEHVAALRPEAAAERRTLPDGASGEPGRGASVSVPNGYATVASDDLQVVGAGGPVRWQRIWDGQEWKFNPQWESLSQSWKNLTGSRSADTTGATLPGGAGGGTGSAGAPMSAGGASGGDGGGCWVWVDEDWSPSTGTTTVGGVPQAGPMLAARTTPFNRLMGERAADYPPAQRVSVDFAALCAGAVTGGASYVDTEGIRRINELYLGDGRRYAFNNRTVLDKRAVRELPAMPAASLEAALAGGRLAAAPATNAKGFRWQEKGGEWIDYDTQGQVVAWGDRNDNVTWLARDTDGRVRGAVDAASGRVLFSLHYTGPLLTEVRDYPAFAGDLAARSVKYEYDELNRLVRVTDVRGGLTRYDYDAANRLVKITDPEGRSEQLGYAGGGAPEVTRHTAADGAVTDYTFEYDDTNKQFVSRITGPETAAGRRVEDITHNRTGQLVRRIVNGRTDEEVRYDTGTRTEISTNARGFATRTVRNEFDQIVEIVHPDGGSVKRSYSALHLELVEETDEAGVKTRHERDAKGNLLKRIEAAGTPDERVTDYVRDAQGRLVQLVRRGRTETDGSTTPDAVWRIEYDAVGQIAKTTDPEGSVRRYTYDRAGNLAVYTDPRGNVTRYEVDADGHLIRETNPLGQSRSYVYDKVGNLVSETDARGKAVLLAYDAMNRLRRRTSAVGGLYQAQYNAQGLMISETDEDGRSIQLEYDNFLRLTRRLDALGNVVRFGYELDDGSGSGQPGSLGDPVQVDYPGFSQVNRFDARERPVRNGFNYRNAQGEQSTANTARYDRTGRILSETDAGGNVRTNRYDALGQRVESTDALGAKTLYRYDARGNLLEVTNANGHPYKFTYDRNDRLVSETRPQGQTIRYQYDAAGNLIQKTGPDGKQLAYTFDAKNRIVRLEQKGADGSLLRTTTQSWDANDNLTAWTDTDHVRAQTSSATLGYDDLNRRTSETVIYPAGNTLGYSVVYSPAGKMTDLIWPDGTRIGYAYSLHGELQSVTVPGEGTLSVDEYAWIAPRKITFPGGSSQTRGFDGLLNLESLEVRTPSVERTLGLSNQFGPLQELRSRLRTDAAGSGSSGRREQFGYDAETRLTQVRIETGLLTGDSVESFTLDALANRRAHSRTPGTWHYDANERLVRIGDGACGTSDTVCYEWDAAGNLIRQTGAGNRITRYRYDSQNRLSEVGLLDPSGNAELLVARYGYDPLDRRIWKEVYRDRAGRQLGQALRTYYLYGAEGLLAEATQPIAIDAAGGVTAGAAPQISAQYAPRPENEFTTGLLLVKTRNSKDEPVVAYYHHDHLNAPIQATDKGGNLVWAARYDAFGRAQITTPAATPDRPTIESNLRLPGQYEDAETGLHYNHRRYYDPDTGRYLTEDPIGLEGGIELYAYAHGSPLLLSDPSGENPIAVGIAIARAMAIMCARYPRICKEMIKCAKNPLICKEKICTKVFGVGQGRRRLVHKVCDSIPAIDPKTDSCASAMAKCTAVAACLGLRELETKICFNGKRHKPGDPDDIEEQTGERLKKCVAKAVAKCRHEQCYGGKK